jgi:proteic killer suppression protein
MSFDRREFLTNDLCSTLDVTRNFCYFPGVIVSYRDKRTRDFAAGKFVKAFSGFKRSARLKLDRLEAATSLGDLAALPGNRFEALLGDRKGQYSIRINDQWRLCFEWPAGLPGPSNVEIVDYH